MRVNKNYSRENVEWDSNKIDIVNLKYFRGCKTRLGRDFVVLCSMIHVCLGGKEKDLMSSIYVHCGVLGHYNVRILQYGICWV